MTVGLNMLESFFSLLFFFFEERMNRFSPSTIILNSHENFRFIWESTKWHEERKWDDMGTFPYDSANRIKKKFYNGIIFFSTPIEVDMRRHRINLNSNFNINLCIDTSVMEENWLIVCQISFKRKCFWSLFLLTSVKSWLSN